jgi:hypothetical protein
MTKSTHDLLRAKSIHAPGVTGVSDLRDYRRLSGEANMIAAVPRSLRHAVIAL